MMITQLRLPAAAGNVVCRRRPRLAQLQSRSGVL